MSFQNLQWVVQENLTQAASFQALSDACKSIGIEFFGFTLRPFAEEAPDYPKGKQAIFYGSTSLMYQVYPNRGLFYTPEVFSMENYLAQYGAKMLNYGAKVMTLQNLINSDFEAGELLFIRPDADSKSFSGTVMEFSEIRNWVKKLTADENTVTPQTLIIAGKAFQIKAEWRLWIVEKRVVAASKYAENHRLVKGRGCPEVVKIFAEDACQIYVPHDIFVMDICLCGDDYYIVECGCMNAAGFYEADIEAIVRAVSEWMMR